MANGPEKLEVYLSELKSRLRDLPEAELSDIVSELRSHVRDSTGEDLSESAVEGALERLGSPAELASLYKTESLLARAGESRSPWLLLGGVVRWATESVVGFFTFLGLLIGYVLTVSFFLSCSLRALFLHRSQ